MARELGRHLAVSRELSDPHGSVAGMDELTDLERAVLDFEGRWWRTWGAKVTAIWETFELTDVRYHQIVHGLLDRPQAALYAPQTVARLRRVRERQMRLRRAS